MNEDKMKSLKEWGSKISTNKTIDIFKYRTFWCLGHLGTNCMWSGSSFLLAWYKIGQIPPLFWDRYRFGKPWSFLTRSCYSFFGLWGFISVHDKIPDSSQFSTDLILQCPATLHTPRYRKSYDWAHIVSVTLRVNIPGLLKTSVRLMVPIQECPQKTSAWNHQARAMFEFVLVYSAIDSFFS